MMIISPRLKTGIQTLKKLKRRVSGDIFANSGAITDKDFEEIRKSIDEVCPAVFIEIGTGKGVSTNRIFHYLQKVCIECDFYTIEIFKQYVIDIRKRFDSFSNFQSIHGLSVRKDETTPPASDELVSYSGPTDVLRNLLNLELNDRCIDIVFIDSRKGSALAEFKVVEERLSKNGVIFCHDILNGGKGVEVLEYLEACPAKYIYEVINTGPMGMIKISNA